MSVLFPVLLFFIVVGPVSCWGEEVFFTKKQKISLVASREFFELGKDFSGAAYNPASGKYLILDDSCKIFEILHNDGWIEHERTVRLRGLNDCEDLAVLEDGRLALAEEGRGRVVFFNLSAEGAEIDCRRNCAFVEVEKVAWLKERSGLEALAAHGRVLYSGREHSPKRFYRLIPQNKTYKILQPWDAEEKLPKASDIAGMAFFEGSLFVLDEQGEMIRQVNPADGEIISEFKLPHFASPRHQYEGIAFARRGSTVEMLIAAEKNEIQVYSIN